MKKRNSNFFFDGGARNIIVGVVIFFGALLCLSVMTDITRNKKTISYSTFLDKVEDDAVKKVYVSDSSVEGILKDGTQFETVVPRDSGLWQMLRAHGVEFTIAAGAGQFSFWHLLPLLSLIMVGAFAWYFIRQNRNSSSNNGGGNNIFGMGKSRARMYMPSTIKESFDSVAGAQGAKEELKDVVDFLKNPEKYERLGARITRGVLLVGDPGNGKTLLARAVAGEANCPFFSVSGSDFIEVFVGVGAARVRDLFTQARKYAPCIIFIDEIDSVGRQRGSGLGGGNDEREQTLNQLLAEMDGFTTATAPIIVLAATNRQDVLDKALLRPGRFDRQVTVPFPDLKSRYDILRLHAEPIKIGQEVDLKRVARGTSGFSGADLANLLNEAAINASKNNQEYVMPIDIELARDKILAGKENKTLIISDGERKAVAYHEAGHALIRVLMAGEAQPLHKVTILTRGHALGLTWALPEGDRVSEKKSQLIAEIMVALGGRIAEELVYGWFSSGASNDLEKATQIARIMVCYYGMAKDLGPRVFKEENGLYGYSSKTADKIDEEVLAILNDAYARVTEMLTEHRDKLDALAEALVERETLDAKEVYALFGMEYPEAIDHSLVDTVKPETTAEPVSSAFKKSDI